MLLPSLRCAVCAVRCSRSCRQRSVPSLLCDRCPPRSVLLRPLQSRGDSSADPLTPAFVRSFARPVQRAMWATATRAIRGAARATRAAGGAATTRIRSSRRVAAFAAGTMIGCGVAVAAIPAPDSTASSWLHSAIASLSPSDHDERSWLHSALAYLSPSMVGCVGHDDSDEDKHKHAVATKTWRYYSGPGGELSNMRLFSGNSNPELAKEIASYLGIQVSSATVGHFIDGETKIQINENVRQTHCFVVQPVSSPVNDTLMELLLLISTLRRASAAEITAVIPY